MTTQFVERLKAIRKQRRWKTKEYQWARMILDHAAKESRTTQRLTSKYLTSDYFPPIPKYLPPQGKSIISKIRKFLISLMP